MNYDFFLEEKLMCRKQHSERVSRAQTDLALPSPRPGLGPSLADIVFTEVKIMHNYGSVIFPTYKSVLEYHFIIVTWNKWKQF